MDKESRICQNCKQDFAIESDDFVFYQKIQVPPPRRCPDCRLQRRLAYRNERMIHKRTCDLCGQSFIGMFPQDVGFPVYCHECWWSDNWDSMASGVGYDLGRSFFEQFQELRSRVPRPGVNNSGEMVNSFYVNCAADMKNCYLVFGAQQNENSRYSHYLNNSKECLDILYGFRSERCYDCFDIDQCYNVRYSQAAFSCRDSFFLYDCRDCASCVGCVGLRHKSYYIFNKPCSKEEYLEKLKEFNLSSQKGVAELSSLFYDSAIFKNHPRRAYHGQLNKDSAGDYINECENSANCFYVKGLRECKNIFWGQNMKDVRDYFAFGDTDELSYECVSGGYGNYNCKFSEASWVANRNMEYCANCFNCESIFGCIGLRKKKFCVFNRQYSEDEYRDLVEKIKTSMLTRGEYGEFFPIEISPFAYQDSVAQEHFPLTKTEVISKSYVWYEPEKKFPKITLDSDALPDSILDVKDEILNETIGCRHASVCEHPCTVGFKITPEEILFYRNQKVPLPRLCFQCRHADRVKLRNPLKLWQRKCMKPGCSNEFKTSYAPPPAGGGPEIVYCEACYNNEIA